MASKLLSNKVASGFNVTGVARNGVSKRKFKDTPGYILLAGQFYCVSMKGRGGGGFPNAS